MFFKYLYWDVMIFALSKQSSYSLEMIDTWQKLPYGFSQSMAKKKKKKPWKDCEW